MSRLCNPTLCLERALECDRLAKLSPGPDSKKMFAAMAMTWRRLAVEQHALIESCEEETRVARQSFAADEVRAPTEADAF
jgi:hypothetical protein